MSQAYLTPITGIYSSNIRQISGIFQAYLRHISDIHSYLFTISILFFHLISTILYFLSQTLISHLYKAYIRHNPHITNLILLNFATLHNIVLVHFEAFITFCCRFKVAQQKAERILYQVLTRLVPSFSSAFTVEHITV